MGRDKPRTSQYVGVLNALRDFDPEPVAAAGALAKELLEILQGRYGAARVYLGACGDSARRSATSRPPGASCSVSEGRPYRARRLFPAVLDCACAKGVPSSR
jgi:hypothetical protein